jgi:glucuronate isomerase
VRRAYRANEIENRASILKHEIRPKQRKHRREMATMLISFVVCALAWWWHISSSWWMNSTPTGIERLYPWLDTLTEVLNFPGWLVVMIVDPRESPMLPATKLTDTLIPILSGLFWALLVLLFVKLWRIFGGCVHKSAKS